MLCTSKSLFAILFTFCFVQATFAENPIVQTNYSADPGSLVSNGTFYIFAGRDQASEKAGWFRMLEWRVYSSTDMVNWTDNGPKLRPLDFNWSNGDAWASQCVEKDGKYYWYISANHRTIGGKAIGVAVSSSPTGSFTDARGSALITTNMTPNQGDFDDIDPTVFLDDDGQAYLYWGNGKCKYVKLNNDMISTSDSVHYAAIPRFGEAPWLHKYNGVYYLSYSSGLPSTIEYCTAPSPTGPWTYRGRILETVKGCQTSHQAITQYQGHWYLVYHTGTLPGGNNFRRSVCVEEFTYNADGTIPTIQPSAESVLNPVSNLNPFKKVEAETMAWSAGLSTLDDVKTGVVITGINNDDYLKIRQVDFTNKAAKSFIANVSSDTEGGRLEIRLDGLEGQLLGVCNVTNTGSLNNWKEVTAKLEKAKGIHDVYLVFKGGEGLLFNFDWWVLKR